MQLGSKVKISDIAKRAGVSRAAVSQALNPQQNSIRIAPQKIEMIRQIAEEMNYRPSKLSRALRSNNSQLIGLILPWNAPETIDTIEHSAHLEGYKLLLQFTGSPASGREAEALYSMLDWNVDGILWEPSAIAEGCAAPLAEVLSRGMPLVFLERTVNDPETSSFPVIKTDYSTALCDCVVHLARQGYRKIVYCNDREILPIVGENAGILQEAAKQNGMGFKMAALSEGVPNRQAEFRKLLEQETGQDTVFFCNNWDIAELSAAMKELNLSAPADFGYVMLTDLLLGGRLRISNLTSPTVTAIRVDSAGLATAAVQRLLADIRQTPFNGALKLDAQLIIQQSTTRTLD